MSPLPPAPPDVPGALPRGGPWWIVVPVKGGAGAKSRLDTDARLHGDPWLRAALARAITADTVTALLESPRVAGVLAVVADTAEVGVLRAAGARVLVEPPEVAGDLNAALRAGIRAAHSRAPEAPLALVLGDLPALDARSVGIALDTAVPGGPAVFVADTDGSGTTLLARRGVDPEPRFGAGSAAAHRAAMAVEISALVPPDLRRDVDTGTDLDEAVDLGVGPATAQLLARLEPGRLQPGSRER